MKINNKKNVNNSKLNFNKISDLQKNNQKKLKNEENIVILLDNKNESNQKTNNILELKKCKKFLNFLKIEKKFNSQITKLKKKIITNNTKNKIKFEIQYFIKKNNDLIKNLKELYKEELESENNFEENLSINKLISKNDINEIRNLLLSGKNPNETNNEGHSLLYYSIIQEKKKITKLLSKFEAQLLWSEIPKKSLTQYSIESDLNSIRLKLYLKKNEINSTSFSETQKTPLSSAVYFKKIESVKLLLKNGADPNIKDIEGKIAIHYSYRIGLECYEILKNYYSDLEISDKNGFYPIHYACSYGNENILKFFIKNKCDIRRVNLNGENGVFLAAAHGNINVVKCLLINGIDINNLNISKQSALHYSVINEKFEMTNFLLENGAFTNLRDINHKTPLDYSKKVNNHRISKLIEKWE